MTSNDQLERVRKICFAFPETTERLSHGEPTFFVRGKKVFVMFANNHHGDGRIAVWVAAPLGLQELLVNTKPETFFKPPYVGVRGWIGIQLNQISDEDLQFYISGSWFLGGKVRLSPTDKEGGR
jgi:hypothetical protein